MLKLGLCFKLACVKSLQSCPTLCDPMDYSLPGSSLHGLLRQEYWSGLPCPSLGDLSNPGIEPAYSAAPALKADSFCLATGEAHFKRIRTLVIIIISYLSNEYKIFSFISITLKVKVAQSCPTL